jgi:hypothetical protein
MRLRRLSSGQLGCRPPCRGEEPLMRRCCRNSQMPSAAFDGPWHRPALEGTVIVALRGQTPTTTAPCQAEHRR